MPLVVWSVSLSPFPKNFRKPETEARKALADLNLFLLISAGVLVWLRGPARQQAGHVQHGTLLPGGRGSAQGQTAQPQLDEAGRGGRAPGGATSAGEIRRGGKGAERIICPFPNSPLTEAKPIIFRL
jgi:hypothetical protein